MEQFSNSIVDIHYQQTGAATWPFMLAIIKTGKVPWFR